MNQTIEQTLSSRMLTTFALLSAVTLLGQVIGWAATACQEPNPNTVFCTELGEGNVDDCTEVANPAPCEPETGPQSMEHRENFPDGPVSSQTGATKEVSENCSRLQLCMWDENENEGQGGCVGSGDYGAWQKEDMTDVNAENECPTPGEE